jgi:hypothetical protein
LGKVYLNAEEQTMLIGGVSTFNSTATVFNPVLAPVHATAASAGSQTNAATPSNGTATAPAGGGTSAPARASSRENDKGGGAAASAGPAAAASAMMQMVAGYSVTVNGKQYAGSVEESNGQYSASANLTGATATGSSEQAVEDNLEVRIDELV